MPSPFPGMDPYIEDPEVWSDFHSGLAAEIRETLNQNLRPRYVARMTPYVTYESLELTRPYGIRPDVGVWRPKAPMGGGVAEALAVKPAPAGSRIPQDVPLRLYTVEIHATTTMELVTAIEILSPANKKRGAQAFDDYLRKRRDLFRSSAHVMEIDLTRFGERPPLQDPIPPAPYYITLSRADQRPHVEVWPIQLSEALPVLPVPLREPDPDAALDLGVMVAATYDHGGYDMLINYTRQPPPPPFTDSELDWLDERLHAEGRR